MTNVQQMTDEELSRWIAEKYGHVGHSQNGYCNSLYRADDCSCDFVNNPKASMMLLQLPGFVSMCFIDEDNAYDVTFCGAKVHNVDCGAKMVTLIRPKLGRCIAECYALSLGDEPK